MPRASDTRATKGATGSTRPHTSNRWRTRRMSKGRRCARNNVRSLRGRCKPCRRKSARRLSCATWKGLRPKRSRAFCARAPSPCARKSGPRARRSSSTAHACCAKGAHMLKGLRHTFARLGGVRRTSDCARFGALLPLHVAGDLSSVQTQLVARHLHACADCCAQFDEYAASRAWLQAGALVAFGDEFYDDIRANVLRRIKQQRPPAPFFAPLFNRRFAYAAATLALLCICGALAWRAHEQQQRRSE